MVQQITDWVCAHVKEAVVGLDASGVVQFVNPSACYLLHLTTDEMIGKPLSELVQDFDAEHNSYTWEESPIGHACRQHNAYEAHTEFFQSKTGHDFPVSYRCVPTEETADVSMLLFFEDTTQQRMQMGYLRKVMNHDPLTGVPNRQLFMSLLDRALSRAKREKKEAYLLFLDLDGFKQVNDTLGHEAGDHLLVAVTERLQSCLRESDSVARMGGDEFTVILEDAKSIKDVEVVADKIIEALCSPFNLSDHKNVKIGTSVGISIYPKQTESVEELIRLADAAMYEAKKTKGCYVFAADQEQAS